MERWDTSHAAATLARRFDEIHQKVCHRQTTRSEPQVLLNPHHGTNANKRQAAVVDLGFVLQVGLKVAPPGGCKVSYRFCGSKQLVRIAFAKA